MIKLEDVERGYARWAAKPHNAKWVRRIDGTPIANDICVNIFEELKTASPSPISADAVVEACAQLVEVRLTTLLTRDSEVGRWLHRLDGDAIREIAAAIRALKGTFPAVDGWRTMDTAPKDGTVVVGWGEYRERDGFSPAFMRWYGSVNGWSVNAMPFYPTHWRELPAAPSATDGETKP